MNVAYIYAGSWEFAYPQVRDDFDRRIWCDSDDFIFKYPRAAMPHGIHPTFFYFSKSGQTVQEFTHKYGFPLRRIPVGRGTLNHEWSLRLFREIGLGAYDLLHFYSYYRNRLFPDMFDLFAFYCRVNGRPFVTHYQVGEFPKVYHGGWIKKLVFQPRRLLKAWSLRSARRIFSLNRLEIERLTNSAQAGFCGLAVDPAKCVYLPNIVDSRLFYPMDKNSARGLTGCGTTGPCLLYAGFLRREKGVQHAIRLMPRLERAFPGIQLWILGNGDYEPELRSLAETMGLEKQVRFEGPVPNHRLCPYFNMADVHLLPSYTESFGTVLIEAMACGTPSIGTRVGGIPEALSDGAGLLVPPRDEDALFEAISLVLKGGFRPDPEIRRRKLLEYSYPATGSILARAYEDALCRKEGGPS